MLSKFDKLSVSAIDNQTRSTSTDEATYKSSYYDKQSGSYGRVTAKESVSSGDYINRGRVGYKDEYKVSSTVRVGDDKGYIEHHKQEKVTRVDYSGRNTNNTGGNRDCGDDSGIDHDDYSQADDAIHADDGVTNHDVPVHADNDAYDKDDFSDDGVGYDDFYGGSDYDDFDGGGGYDGYYYSDSD